MRARFVEGAPPSPRRPLPLLSFTPLVRVLRGPAAPPAPCTAGQALRSSPSARGGERAPGTGRAASGLRPGSLRPRSSAISSLRLTVAQHQLGWRTVSGPGCQLAMQPVAAGVVAAVARGQRAQLEGNAVRTAAGPGYQLLLRAPPQLKIHSAQGCHAGERGGRAGPQDPGRLPVHRQCGGRRRGCREGDVTRAAAAGPSLQTSVPGTACLWRFRRRSPGRVRLPTVLGGAAQGPGQLLVLRSLLPQEALWDGPPTHPAPLWSAWHWAPRGCLLRGSGSCSCSSQPGGLGRWLAWPLGPQPPPETGPHLPASAGRSHLEVPRSTAAWCSGRV